ncbi:MAG: hypothetical protein LBU99_04120, partial [Spirochaetaceae bacterium]|nr:hypothetical protein [Spirochaetaceae bacterium]
MRKERIVNRYWLVLLYAAAAFAVAGCGDSQFAATEGTPSGALIDTSPVTIKKQGNSDDITSYQTSVAEVD